MVVSKQGTARLGALVLGLLAASGCAPSNDTTDARSDVVGASGHAIVNGQYDPGDPAVVALAADGMFVCSGTLITPTVVLTAAHCLPPNIPVNGFTDMAVFFGSDISSPGTVIGVLEGWTHPGWTNEGVRDDIGLLRLSAPGPATPIPVNTAPLNNGDVGDPVRLIGFGITGPNNQGTSGRKRQGNTVVDAVYQTVFTMLAQPSGTCSGDSGGTALMDRGAGEVVAGIHSRSDCINNATDTRVAVYLPEINSFIGAIEPGRGFDAVCATGCTEPDPDCPCAGDGFCTTACADPLDDPDCDPGCGQDGMCVLECPAKDPDCTVCGADDACDPTCIADPDCARDDGPCSADGQCDLACTDDPDCWNAGDLSAEQYDGDVVESSCQLGRAGRQRSTPWLWAALALLGLRRRRRS
jgi:V8-like Glu-specific endopeptidase